MAATQAIVIGASITGLVAARVLSRRFTHVIVVDRDWLPAANDNRRGVPQGRHGHGLLASGFTALKTLFPELERELIASGAVPGDVIGDVRWFQHGYYKAKFPSDFAGILLSRPLLEGTLRRLVTELPNVSIVDRTHVSGLATDKERRRVTGILFQRAERDTGIMRGQLVIDAGGRASRSPQWLSELGFARPEEQSVHVDLGYTTRTFRRQPSDLGGDLGAIIGPHPPAQKRAGFALAMEGNRWMVTLGGWLGDHAPTDARGYADFARSLPRPDVYDIVKNGESLTEAATYVFPSNLRRRYERLGSFPEGYLVMGDAVCSFNPFYGQGMSVAALEGQALERALDSRGSLESIWRPFFQASGRIVETPWTIAAGSDFAFPGVTGPKPMGTGAINAYLARVHQAASADASLCRTFFDVANLLKPATTLFRPAVVARVLRGCLRPPAPLSENAAPRVDDAHPPIARSA
jgi:2-polyprenyl-6-methoxyphenol hydroxylase-like FAD-dependent oxidoreductase